MEGLTAKRSIDETLRQTASSVASEGYARQMFEIQKGAGAGWSFSLPNTKQADAMARRVLNTKYTANLTRRHADLVKDEITGGILAGKSEKDIAKQIRETAGGEIWEAKRLVRTEITAAASEGELQAIKDVEEEFGIVMRYRFYATLDERTCPVCGALDLEEFSPDNAQEGVNRPPMHPNCRCVIQPVTPGDLKEEVVRRGRLLDKETGKMRNEVLPPGTTFEKWKTEFATGGKYRTTNNYENELKDVIKIERHPSQKQLDSIRAYQDDHGPFNMAMRGQIPVTSETAEHIWNMENAAERITLKEDVRLMRGITVTEYFPVPKAGKTLNDPAFLSTSTNYGIAERYAKDKGMGAAIMYVDVPKGTRVLPASYLTGYKEQEQELFLMPNQELYIRKVVQPTGGSGPSYVYAEVRARPKKWSSKR